MFLQLSKIIVIIIFVLIPFKDTLGWDIDISQYIENVDGRIKKLALKIEEGVISTSKYKISVANFTVERTRATDKFGPFVTEQLELAFSQSKKFKLVEQHHLERLLGRRKLEMSDLYDEETVKKLGRFEGVDALLLGTYWDYGEQIKVIAKLIDIETAEQIGTADVMISKTTIPQRYFPNFEGIKEKPSSITSDQYFVEAYQIDEIARVFVNNRLVLEVEIPVHSSSIDYDKNFKRVEITDFLRPGENSVRLVVINRSLPLDWGRCGYGFKVFKNSEVLWEDAKKYHRSYDPDGVFYDKDLAINVEEDYFRINYLPF